MNNLPIPDEPLIDITRWLGAIPVILQQIADCELMTIAGACLMFGFAWLLVYKLTSWGGSQ